MSTGFYLILFFRCGGGKMIEPIKANARATLVHEGAVPEQKKFDKQEIPRTPVERKTEVPTSREDIPREQVEKAAEKLNRLMGIIDKRLKFSIHEKSGELMVKIIDQNSGDVIDEIPSRKMLDFLASFKEFVGLLVDKHV